jgi:hypothetical protein
MVSDVVSTLPGSLQLNYLACISDIDMKKVLCVVHMQLSGVSLRHRVKRRRQLANLAQSVGAYAAGP